ncbi:MAG: glycoside hydrolase family 127 protein [Clostridia bacterium]|nr:glycoside hydrolase family 127 protein [Clostridia bacterium]
MDKQLFSSPIDLKQITVTDPFWHREMELVRKEVIPYQWDALNDRVPGADPSWCMRNFRTAGKMMAEQRQNAQYTPPAYSYRGFNALPDDPANPEEGRFYGFVFQDTDFSKWIEAVGYSLTQHPDPELEKLADEAIDVVCAAQTPDGYLDTYYIINGMDAALTNLRDHHELYCLGHLVEGAVAYYQATGKDKLLRAAARFADYIAERFGPEEGKCKGYPGHEIAEMALVRLYEVTGEEKYLKLSKFFVDQRGQKPFYFAMEDKARAEKAGQKWRGNPDDGSSYHQANKPVREQDEAVGHAVRAVYLYSGMADVARLTGDDELLAACQRLWDNIVHKKLYVTGGIGGTVHGEAFSYEYDLPNDSAYSETCAAIGLAFFARRMLQIRPDSQYADVMELALYNTVLSGMALDGKSFFYVNPLAVVPSACRKDQRLHHVQPIRRKWFGCACCPPNIARIVSSIASYAYTENEDTLFTHLYVGGEIRKDFGGKQLTMQVDAKMPWHGHVYVTLHCDEPVTGTLAFRMPNWAPDTVLTCGDKQPVYKDGYAYFTGEWHDGDMIRLHMPMMIRMVAANPAVREDVDKVAFMRGPVTFCAEQADNGDKLHLLRVDTRYIGDHGEGIVREFDFDTFGYETVRLHVPAKRLVVDENGPLYTPWQPPKEETTTIHLVPYYTWANRGEGEMLVWLRRK